MGELVHHLVPAAEWPGASTLYRPASLGREGFIHFSSTEQVPATSIRYYRDVDALLLVTVDVDLLDSPLVWEDLAGTGAHPHLYGPLDPAAIVSVRRYRPGCPVGTASAHAEDDEDDMDDEPRLRLARPDRSRRHR